MTDKISVFLSTLPPSCGERRLALTAVLVSLVGFLAVAPFATVQLVQVWAFIPVYQSALVFNDLIVAVLLFGQFGILRSNALYVLACGYLFTSFIAVFHALTFPGLFSATGLLGAGPQSTAWLYLFWHAGFPLFVIAYALLKNESFGISLSDRNPHIIAFAGVVAVLILALGGTLVVTIGHDVLPEVVQNNRYTPVMLGVLALVILWWQRPYSTLDLWLSVVMCAWLFEVALSAILSGGQFDLGFYVGRLYGLFSAGFILVVLLLESSGLYARLVKAYERECEKNTDLLRLSQQIEKRAEEHTLALDELHNKEEEILAILDNLLDCVICIDSKGIVRRTNPAVERVLGFAADEIIGYNISMLMPKPHREQHDGYLAHYLRTGEARIIGIGREVEGQHKDGRLIPLELAITDYAIRGERFFVGILRDISERKRFIAEFTEARADAEQASRAKSAFLATMSHEIRTPMNGVIGMVDVLTQTHLSEHQTDLVRTIRESALTLLAIIDDILDFSKIEAGRLEIEQAPVSISDLVEGVCRSLVPVSDRRGVDLALFISPEIPEHLLSDDVRLRQVFYNLIGNAIKFSAGRPEQRGHVSISVTVVEMAPLCLAFRIADNGIGMTPETVRNLFTPFTQAEISTTRRFGGTGLGLAISKRLVDLLQGKIDIESTPDKGSVFIVTLPFLVAEEQPLRSLPDISGLNCIVVKNLIAQTDDWCVYLAHAGADVHLATDVETAAQIAAGLAGVTVAIQYVGGGRLAVNTAYVDLPDVRHLLITQGRRRWARVESDDVVTLDGTALRRHALLRAVAITAGRASPEVFHEHSDEDLSGEQTVVPSIADARTQGSLILIAEDDDINQKVILQQLALLGYAAEVAGNGAEALQFWRNGRYALLLTDLHMPEMDGYTLSENIRREEAGRTRMPILALTANALRGEASCARAAGIDEYLTKPVQLHLLRAALEKWLQGKGEPATPEQVPEVGGLATAYSPSFPASLSEQVPEVGGLATAVVDLSVLKRLVGDDAAIVKEFLTDYLASLRRLVGALRAACAAADAPLVGAIAHKFKSSSRSVGALALGDLCASLENAGKAEDQAAIRQKLMLFELAQVEVETFIVGFLEGE